jgi:alkanesulfonate monooxygenase SsuD/methylene tetrahydromethanopterin reductase-like flavin-dependent oxidoreductase (luciferase family)
LRNAPAREQQPGRGRCLAFLRLRSGRPGRYPTSEDAAAYKLHPREREIVKAWTGSRIVGSSETVRRQLAELVDRTDANGLMITTMTHGPPLVGVRTGSSPARQACRPHPAILC